MIRVAIVGFGHWGKIWGKKVESLPDFSLVGICVRALPDATVRPSCPVYTDLAQMLKTARPDLVLVMTPLLQHGPQALEILRHGSPLLITKPIAPTCKDILHLQKEAESRRQKVYVDHTFLYSPGYRTIKAAMNGETPRQIRSERLQWGRFQAGSDVFRELIYHDVYLSLDLCGDAHPSGLDAQWSSSAPERGVDTGTLNLQWGSCRAELHASLASLESRRFMEIQTSQSRWRWDFANQVEFSTAKDSGAGSAEKIPVLNPEPDAITQTLLQIHLDLQGQPAQVYGLADALRVHKILDKAFTPPS